MEVRQIRFDSDADGTDTLPVVLQLPINGRLIALSPLSIPSIPTSALFMLQDHYHYAVVSYTTKPPVTPTPPGQRAKVSAHPVYTHSSGSLETANISRPTEGGTIVAVDPYYRCIAVHAFDGLLTILPVDLSYQPPSNAKSDDNSTRANPRRSKQLLGIPFHCRVEESTILSIAFLCTNSPVGSNESPPIQIAVLHQDSRGLQHLTTHVVNLQKQQIYLHGSQSAPPSVQWMKKSMIDGGSSMLIPVKLPTVVTSIARAAAEANSPVPPNAAPPKNSPAVVVIGQRQFTYCSVTSTKIMPVPQSLFLAYTELPNDPVTDMPRYLLADELGTLHILSFVIANDRVVAMQLEALGSTTLASTLTYLQEGLLFVGSTFGDSQLVQIHDDPIVQQNTVTTALVDDVNNDDQDGGDVLMDTTYLSIVEEYINLGPILDFDLVPTTPQSGPSTRLVQSQVVTASGTSKSGSIRIVRNGIGMYEHASVDIPGIQAMWSLRKTFDSPDDTYLVQSFVGETRVLGVATVTSDEIMTDTSNAAENDKEDEDVGGTLEEVIIPGLVSASSTLYVGNLQEGDRLLQITSSEIQVFEWSGEIVSTWKSQITIATANEYGQIAVSLPGGILVYLVVEGDSIKKMNEKQLDSEVSSLDIQPFQVNIKKLNTDMEIDDSNTAKRTSVKSLLIAVGLWDDFTVRLLSIETSLNEVVCINLGNVDDDEAMDEPIANNLMRQNQNNMMARSLCLVSLDFTSASSTSIGKNKDRDHGSSVDMLFVGMGDGTLVSFAVVVIENTVSVQSKKEVSLGTQRIDLVRLSTEHGGTCVLATGDRPTVIYLAGIVGSGTQITPKLCYSNVNVEPGHDELSDHVGSFTNKQAISVNVATPFFSPLLFNNLALGKQQYSLCVADNSQLKLGVIDDIQKLHVTTCHLGMAPRRIVYCPDGRLYAVGCIESGIQNFGFNGDEANMGNCIRFLEETSFDDLEKVNLEPYEMILSMSYVKLSIPTSENNSTDKPSSAKNTSLVKPFLLVGTAYAFPDEDEPTRGRILVYSCQPDDTTASAGINDRPIRLVTEMLTEGGVYSMCQFYDGRILATVNAKTHICQLVEEVGLLQLQYLGLGHFGHILSLFVKSRAQYEIEDEVKSGFVNNAQLPPSTSGETSSEKETRNPKEMLAVVGDLMRSISLVQFYPEHNTLEEIARDFNANWTCAVEMLNENIYLGAENWNNLFCLRRNTASSNEEMRCRLDTIGEFHLGEMCNKFMSGSLVMPVSSKTTSSSRRQVRRPGSPRKASNANVQSPSKGKMASQASRPIVSTGSQTLFGTVDGTLGVVLGLDSRTAAFFSSLERAMACVIRPVGDFSHQHYRACHAERRINPAHGFVDGDLTETFLDLDRKIMDVVVQEMNRDGAWDIDDTPQQSRNETTLGEANTGSGLNDEMEVQRYTLSVEDVLAMVEEMTMMH